jgi:hypothetical protein
MKSFEFIGKSEERLVLSQETVQNLHYALEGFVERSHGKCSLSKGMQDNLRLTLT